MRAPRAEGSCRRPSRFNASEVRALGFEPRTSLLPRGPARTGVGYYWAMVSVDLERIEALELLGMTLAHLNEAETRREVSARVPLLMAIRDKLAFALREES